MNDYTELLLTMCNDITSVICGRIKEIGKKPTGTAHEYLTKDWNKIQKIKTTALKKTGTKAKKETKSSVSAIDEFTKPFFEYRGLAPLTAENDDKLNDVVKYAVFSFLTSVSDDFDGLAYNLHGKYIPLKKAYTKAINEAIITADSKPYDYDTDMRKTVSDLGNGLYVPMGDRYMTISGAVNETMESTLYTMGTDYLTYAAKKYGYDGIQLSAHAIPAPDHAPLQGRVYTLENWEKMQTNQDFEDVTGMKFAGLYRVIGQWNCRHFPYPIILKAFTPMYSEEKLKEYERNSELKYQATQEMRHLEERYRRLEGEKTAYRKTGDTFRMRETQRKQRDIKRRYNAITQEYNITKDFLK